MTENLADVTQLRSQRLILEPVQPEDTERVYDAAQDSEFARWLPWAVGEYTWDKAEDFTANFAANSWESGQPPGYLPAGGLAAPKVRLRVSLTCGYQGRRVRSDSGCTVTPRAADTPERSRRAGCSLVG